MDSIDRLLTEKKKTYEKVKVHNFYNFEKDSSPKVSIILPVYNVDKYLSTCIQSILNQTYTDFEVLCINDGSKDSSLDILRQYSSIDNRIKVIDMENAGYGHAINIGVDYAKGEYISIIESDDYVKKDFLSSLCKVAEEYPFVEMIKSNAVRFYGDGSADDCSVIPVCKNKLYGKVLYLDEEDDCFKAYMINTTGIYKKSLFDDYVIRLNESKGAAFQDNGLWFQLFTSAHTIFFVDEANYMYRIDREDSSTNTLSYDNAMCIFSEWDYIRGILLSYSEGRKEKYLPVYCARFFGSCYYHFTRIQEEYKLIFLKHLSDELNVLNDLGELKTNLFEPSQIDDLYEIMERPSIHFYIWCNKNIYKFLSDSEDRVCLSINNKIKHLNLLNCLVDEHRDINDIRPKISVIIPIYNMANSIGRCLKSVLSQSLKDIEVICIDDGSNDATLPVLLSFAKEDKRVVVRTQINQGAGIARNTGLKLATGEYIAFMDVDDQYPNERSLEVLYNAAIINDVDICGGNVVINNEGKIERKDETLFEREGHISYVDFQKDYEYQGYIYKRAFLDKNEIVFPNYRRYQDPPFLLRAMICAEEFYAIAEDVYQYNYHPNHIVWNTEKIVDLIRGIKDCILLAKKNNLEKIFYTSLKRLEKDFSTKIVEACTKDPEILQYLIAVQNELRDVKFRTDSEEKKNDYSELLVYRKCIDSLVKKVPSGYIGPNALEDLVRTMNECSYLKERILLVETSLSYRLGVVMKGGIKKAKKRQEWFGIEQLEQLGNKKNISNLRRDKQILEEYLERIYQSRTFKVMNIVRIKRHLR